MAEVYIRDNQRNDEILLLESPIIRFGRIKDNDITPPINYSQVGSVSRHHFRFIRYDVPISELKEFSDFEIRAGSKKTEPLSKDLTKKIGVEIVERGLIPKNAVISVIDSNSLNGTYVNGKKIEGETFLKNGDRVAVGPASKDMTVLEYVLRIV